MTRTEAGREWAALSRVSRLAVEYRVSEAKGGHVARGDPIGWRLLIHKQHLSLSLGVNAFRKRYALDAFAEGAFALLAQRRQQGAGKPAAIDSTARGLWR